MKTTHQCILVTLLACATAQADLIQPAIDREFESAFPTARLPGLDTLESEPGSQGKSMMPADLPVLFEPLKQPGQENLAKAQEKETLPLVQTSLRRLFGTAPHIFVVELTRDAAGIISTALLAPQPRAVATSKARTPFWSTLSTFEDDRYTQPDSTEDGWFTYAPGTAKHTGTKSK